MSYYIAPQSSNLEIGELVIYRVVKRLRDFKAEDGRKYRVFKSKKEMQSSLWVPMYVGVGEKLKKSGEEFILRF
jgi:hypothetical protein